MLVSTPSEPRVFFAHRCLLLLLLTALPATTATLNESEKRGKQIYTRGLNATGKEIRAALGEGGVEVSAAVLSCSKCHGRDGRGREESGIKPSDIRWEILTKPYGLNLGGGRSRVPYGDSQLIRAICLGIDSSGHNLNSAMPLFRLSREQAGDLIAYLRRLGDSTDPGIDKDRLRLGMILPPDASFPPAHAIRAATEAFFDRLNQTGGIYGRLIDLRVEQAPGGPATWRRFTEEQNIFALLNTYIAGDEHEADTFIAGAEIPMVGAYTLFPPVSIPLNPYIFYLNGGVPAQADALAAYAEKQFPGARAVVVAGNTEPWASIARSVVQSHPGVNWEIQTSNSPPAARVTLVLSPGFVSAAAAKITLLIPTDIVSPKSFDLLRSNPNVVFAMSGLPSSISPDAVADYRTLAQSHHLPADHVSAQMTALAACRILQEGLVRSGQELSRDRLLESLEHLYHFDTGYTDAITYGPNTRIGDSEPHLAQFDTSTGQLKPIQVSRQ